MLKKIFLWGLVALVLGSALKTAFVGKEFKPPWKVKEQPSANNGDQLQLLERFELEGFNLDGNQAWQLLGDWAHIQTNENIFIEKNVLLTVEQHAKIYADKVYWQSEKSRFMTERPVKIVQTDVDIEGLGAMGRVDDKYVQLNRKIRMMIHSGTIVTCYGPAKIFYDENRISLHRDVWILDERGAVSADRMDGYFDPKEKELISVIATGNVRISRGEDVTFSDKAIYDTRTGSVRLEGAPEIDIRSKESIGAYEDYLDGDKIKPLPNESGS